MRDIGAYLPDVYEEVRVIVYACWFLYLYVPQYLYHFTSLCHIRLGCYY